MRIAVISDTHDRLPVSVCAAIRGAEEIWHLGDVCVPATLAEFEHLGPPLRVVLGNCDEHFAWPWDLELKRAGVTLWKLNSMRASHCWMIAPRSSP